LGQKVNPIGFRLGQTTTWVSKWFATKKNYSQLLHEDLSIRKFIKDKLQHAGVSQIQIERAGKKCRVSIHTARPGIVIGKKGIEIDRLMKEVQNLTDMELYINIIEIRKPEVEAQLVAENIAIQLERRVAFRRAMKRGVVSALRFGAEGIKIHCAGRLAGTEMARREWYREGRVPLHTISADVDYGFTVARTTYGVIGVKVWVYRGQKEEALKGPEK
jgi:small subunit ribosomal protein S3